MMAIGANRPAGPVPARRNMAKLKVSLVADETSCRQPLINPGPDRRNPTRVADGAIERTMSPSEREHRKRMFKARNLPKLLAMAILTTRQSAIVHVIFLMTSETLLRKTGEFTAIAMALGTIERKVNAGQRETLVKVARDLPAPF